MNLKELKSMIKEEYAHYNEAYSIKVKEQNDPAVDVAPEDVDAEGGDEDPEDTLKDIYDMLKDYFEGGKDTGEDTAAGDIDGDGDVDADDMKAGAPPEEEEEEEEAEAEALQERFKKLANIIKG